MRVRPSENAIDERVNGLICKSSKTMAELTKKNHVQ